MAEVADAPGPAERRPRAASARAHDPADELLVARIVDGDQNALGELYDRYGRPAYSLARRICADDGIAEDVVQEVFLAFWRDPRRFDPERGAFGTWLLTLVHHKSVDAVRRESSIRRRTVPAAEDGDEWSAPPGTGCRPGRAGRRSSRGRCATRWAGCRPSSARRWRWPTTAGTRSVRSPLSPECRWAP